ncbi:MAG: lysophospholipase [Flavobacteriales bacterium]|nr:lysophospholipase [Flavobacteriales bacterium]
MDMFLFTSAVIFGIYLVLCLAYYLFQERLIFIPVHRKSARSLALTKEFQEFNIATPNNGSIHALLIKAAGNKPKGLIFYLHGNTGSIQRWSHMGQELCDFDYDVLVMDYRGYGKSKGPIKEAFMHEDVQTVYSWVKENFDYQKRIIYGRSLGSGFAVPLAANNDCNALILETPFLSLLHVAFHHAPFIPVKWLIRYPMRSDKLITKVKAPILIFHGTRDKLVPFQSAFDLFSLISNDPKNEMVTIPDGKHNNLAVYPIFRERLKAWLNKE